MYVTLNGQKHYHVGFVVSLIQRHIQMQKGALVNITLNLNIPREKELFEKAANVVLHLHNEGVL